MRKNSLIAAASMQRALEQTPHRLVSFRANIPSSMSLRIQLLFQETPRV